MKKLSDRHGSLRSPVVCLKPPRRYPDSGGPGKFLLKTGKLGYHGGLHGLNQRFPRMNRTEGTGGKPGWKGRS